jgi:hypothetical protein
MFGILAVIGLGVILWWISKGLKRLSAFLENASTTLADLAVSSPRNAGQEVKRQNIIAEEKLQSITGGPSNAAYTHQVREEIDTLIKELERR